MPMPASEPWRALRPPIDAAQGQHSASFVSQLKRVERHLDEAQALIVRHQFEGARALVAPHLVDLPEPLAGAVYWLLGRCAMHGAGRNWQGLLHKARSAYARTNDTVGVSQTQLLLGRALFARGDLSGAQAQLRAATQGFTQARVSWGRAMAQGLVAQVCLAQHDAEGALHAADSAIAMWAYLNEASEEAIVRQVRAQLLASTGMLQDAARDLLWAERLVGTGASDDVRIATTLGRAESLLWMGFSHRAAAALSRIAKLAAPHPDPCIRGLFARLMGQALMVDAPVVAAQHLNSAVELTRDLGQSYHNAQAQMYLACCEHRLGMPTRQRMQAVRALSAGHWPVLRDALVHIEQLLAAPPGRLTGPQPPKVFDAESAEAAARPAYFGETHDAAGASSAAPGRHALPDEASVDVDPDSGHAAAQAPWRLWLSGMQTALGRLRGPKHLSGQVTPDAAAHAPHKAQRSPLAGHAPQAVSADTPAAAQPAYAKSAHRAAPVRLAGDVTRA